MKRILFCLFSVAAIAGWCTPGFAFPGQIVAAGGSVNLTTGGGSGNTNGVELQGTGGSPSTLTVNIPEDINTALDGSIAVKVDNGGVDNLIFDTGSSTAHGSVGQSSTLNLASIVVGNTGASTVTFTGPVWSTAMSINGTSSVDFASGTSGANANVIPIITFAAGGDGTITVGANTQLNAAIDGTVNEGTLILNSGSLVIGQVSNAGGIKAITVNGNAAIQGLTQAYNFNLGSNILTVTGALNIGNGTPAGVITTTLINPSTYGQIVASGAATIATGLTIHPDATGLSAGVGARFNIVDAASTPTGVLPIVTNSGGYTFTALPTAANGLVTIVTSGATVGGVPLVAPPVVLTLATLPITLDTIATNVLTGISNLTNQTAINQANAQLGPSDPSLAAPQVTFQGAREFQNLWLSHLEMCNQAGSADEASTCKGTNPSNGVWVKGFGYFGSQDSRPAYNYAGYDDTIFGTMVAYDMPIIDENTRAGVGLGYAHTTIDGKTYETNSNIDFDTFQPTVYIGHDQGPWFVHGSESFGYNQYSQQRGIAISGTDYVAAKSDYSGEDYTTFLNTGYNFSAPLQSTITPIASLQYSRVNMDSYTEKDAGDLDLHAKPQGYDFLESGLGAKVERDFSVHNWHFVPEIHAEWLHDFLNPTMGQTTEFMVGSAPLYTAGIKTDPDTLHAGTSISLLSCTCSKTKLSFEAGYDFYWRNDGYIANQVTMRVTDRF